MPNLDNAKKALRQSLVRAARNTQITARVDFLRRSFRKLLADQKVTEAKALIADLNQALDKAVKKNVLKLNNASRVKSRAVKKLNQLLKK
ncbi:MAG: 30S ribosomal protein S20 [Patescibacteria group bacterium]